MRSIDSTVPRELEEAGFTCGDLVFYITSSCNLRCRHCYVGTELLSQSILFSKSSIISAIQGFAPLSRLTLLGGEPLLHPDVDSILRETQSVEIGEKRITTNLTMLSASNVSALSDSGFRVCVSIDGHDSDSHNSIRGRGMFERTVANLRHLLKAHGDVEVTHVVTSRNIDDFDKLLSLIKGLGVPRLNLHKFTAKGNGSHERHLSVSPTQWRGLVDRLSGCHDPNGSTKIRFELGYATDKEFAELISDGYSHHSQGSFYGSGNRLVFYPDGKIYISSEAFGSDRYIARLTCGGIFFNQSGQDEVSVSGAADYSVTDLCETIVGDSKFPVPLSVSYRRSAIV